jgi:hypothetical protein
MVVMKSFMSREIISYNRMKNSSDVSEIYVTSVFRVEEYAKEETSV